MEDLICGGLLSEGIVLNYLSFKAQDYILKGLIKPKAGIQDSVKQNVVRILKGGTPEAEIGASGSATAEGGEVVAAEATEAATAEAAEAGMAELIGGALSFATGIGYIIGFIEVINIAFSIGAAPFEPISAAMKCYLKGSLKKRKESNNCLSGKKYTTGGRCEPCKQIYGMKEYDSVFKDKYYNYNLNGLDPSNINRITEMSCPQENTYAIRNFPTSGCVWTPNKDTGKSPKICTDSASCEKEPVVGRDLSDFGNSPYDSSLGVSFFTRDPKDCSKSKWDTALLPDKNKTKGDYSFMQMAYSSPPSPAPGECENPTNQYQIEKCAWNKFRISNYTDYIKNEGEESFEYLNQAVRLEKEPTQIPTTNVFDDPNVCKNNLVLAGDYNDQRSSDDISEEKDRVRDRNYSHTSNHCCPGVIGAPDCPNYVESDQVYLFSSPGDFSPKDPKNNNDVSKCYTYDYNNYPEFNPKLFSEKVHYLNQDETFYKYKYNQYIQEVKRGGIQCGPRYLESTSSPDKSPLREGGATQGEEENRWIDIKRPESRALWRPQDPSASEEQYYGTRFKLDNRYKYESKNDSGATGYEYYLDPVDYVRLSDNGEDSELNTRVSSREWETKQIIEKMNIEDYTTINDIIPKQLGHPDNRKPMCDNFICNDIEKTQYTQTLYDNFCTNWGEDSKNDYKKFYRPVGIKKQGWNVGVEGDESINNDEETKNMYPDICCDPIPFSNRWSFIGCDAHGKNPYFIDDIYTDPSPTYPENILRKRIKMSPMPGKRNINQCIPPIEEIKCELSGSSIQDIKNEISAANETSGSFGGVNIMNKFNQYSEICNNYLDFETMDNINNSSFDENGRILPDENLESLCSSAELGGATGWCAQSVIGKLPPGHRFHKESSEYWLSSGNNGRGKKGYLPSKNSISDWNSNPEKYFDFTLRNPNNTELKVYNTCNEITSVNVSDIEIYDKRIDWSGGATLNSGGEQLRFIPNNGETPPPNKELFKVICENSDPGNKVNGNNTFTNYIEVPSSPIEQNGNYYYNIQCSRNSVTEGDIFF